MPLDEPGLGGAVGRSILAVPRRQIPLEFGVRLAQSMITTQPIPKAQTAIEKVAVNDEVQVVCAVRRGRLTQPTAAIEFPVIGWRVLIARMLNEGLDRLVQVADQRHDVDHGLSGKVRNGGRSNVVDLSSREQRSEASELVVETSRPGRVVGNDLDRSVALTACSEIC